MLNLIKFVDPIDGAMLTSAAGNIRNNLLNIEVSLEAEPGRRIFVNGVQTTYYNGVYNANIDLANYGNILEAVDADTGENVKIIVYWLRKAHKKYRLVLDDNIWFLQDIAKNADKYNSIFNNPYMKFFKSVNDQFGTKLHINIYYQCPEFGGFNLAQMTDKFKNEWGANADWIRLSFHADQNLPDRPYENTGYNKMKEDHERVIKEIRRFAEEEVLGPVTTVHWAEATLEGCRALRDQGIRVLSGRAIRKQDARALQDPTLVGLSDNISIAYYLNCEQSRTVRTYGFYKDNSEDIIFSPNTVTLNSHTPEKIRELLDSFAYDYPKRSYIGLIIHEQYFYPHYQNYLSDYKERVLAGVEWCVENGYESSFLADVVFE